MQRRSTTQDNGIGCPAAIPVFFGGGKITVKPLWRHIGKLGKKA